jgi:hypothetical protein
MFVSPGPDIDVESRLPYIRAADSPAVVWWRTSNRVPRRTSRNVLDVLDVTDITDSVARIRAAVWNGQP